MWPKVLTLFGLGWIARHYWLCEVDEDHKLCGLLVVPVFPRKKSVPTRFSH